VRFYLDNNLSYRFARALTALGDDVRALREEFPENTADVEWIPKIKDKDACLITADKRIITRPHECLILRQANITTFFLGPFFLSLQFWPQAAWIVKHWPTLRTFGDKSARGTCFFVQHNGRMNAIPLSG
jgi:predicted nuclease of predicted toxin-antitoxin system